MTRFATAHPLKNIALIILAGLLTVTSAAARHRKYTDEAVPGTFDYYVLSLSWSPAFCLDKPGAAECGGTRRFGFIVHGLWPQYENGWPENCNADRQVPEEVAAGISDLMPARALVYHEWAAHGSCSGLNPADFFALVRRVRSSVAIPDLLSGPRQASEQPPAAIGAAFVNANRQLAAQSIIVTCGGQDSPRLREVRICFDRDLRPRACSVRAARASCRAPSLIVPPIR